MPHKTATGAIRIAIWTRSAFFWRRSSSSCGSAPILVSHVALLASQPGWARASKAAVVRSTGASSRFAARQTTPGVHDARSHRPSPAPGIKTKVTIARPPSRGSGPIAIGCADPSLNDAADDENPSAVLVVSEWTGARLRRAERRTARISKCAGHRRRASTIQARASNHTPSSLACRASVSRSRWRARSESVRSMTSRASRVLVKPRTHSSAEATFGP
jgi:hypothetical protein